MLPLASYGIPYAYASVTSSSYVVQSINSSGNTARVHCTQGDYETGGGGGVVTTIVKSEPQVYDFTTGIYRDITHIETANAWVVEASGFSIDTTAQVTCQSPITVAGIGVPQFGSLYVAIALGAVFYFILSRRYAGRPTISTQVET
jgi:hypothetical protein